MVLEHFSYVSSVFTTNINKLFYGAFVLLSAYFTFFGQDYVHAASQLGIALIFDPFDANVSFTMRPRWQRFWLYLHLAAVLVLFTIHFVW